MNPSEITEQKFITFFDQSLRKKTDEEPITLDLLKTNLNNVFRMCKPSIFKTIESINDYSFYNLLVDNWEKESPSIIAESYSSVLNQQIEASIEKILPIDGSLFLYLKEVSQNTNKEYFWFLLKFIVVFRECLNTLRKELVQPQHTKENKTEYTQIYNAETVPAICNEFFSDFMEPNQYFGLDDTELIETIQHLCSWLFTHGYTKSQLTLK